MWQSMSEDMKFLTVQLVGYKSAAKKYKSGNDRSTIQTEHKQNYRKNS